VVATSDPGTAVAVRERVIKLLLADDHPLMLDGIRKALSAADDIEVVGEARSGREALALAARTQPDAVLLDLRMPQMDGLACLQELKRIAPEIRVIILSATEEPRQIRAALRLGADAYVVKSVNPVDLASVVRQTMDGTTFTALADGDGDPLAVVRADGLSDREIAILSALASGLSNQAIGRKLWVSEQTIKFHLRNIYRKLGLSNRTEAAHYAHEAGLVDGLRL
jgi:DNA-binding NarL/FixJ family response regulator